MTVALDTVTKVLRTVVGVMRRAISTTIAAQIYVVPVDMLAHPDRYIQLAPVRLRTPFWPEHYAP